MTGNLERLPLEIVDNICRYTPRRDLFKLSLANRFCDRITERYRFSHIRIKTTCNWDLRRNVDRWESILGRNNRFSYVRRVIVFGVMNEDAAYISCPEHHWQKAPPFWDDGDDMEKEDLTQNINDIHVQDRSLGSDSLHAQTRNEAWLPLAKFLERVTDLTDLAYACPQQIPSCVLATLRQHHPRSRLHVSRVHFRDVISHFGTDQAKDRLEEEDVLLTSPCLYSIRITDEPGPDGTIAPRIEEAVLRLIQSGRASRLRYIHNLTRRFEDQQLDLSTILQRLTPIAEVPTKPELVELHTLRFTETYAPESLLGWSTLVDFSHLRHFEFQKVTISALQLFISHVRSGGNGWFRALRSLNFMFDYHDLPWTDDASVVESLAIELFSLLPPLEALTLQRFTSPKFLESILYRHGPALRKLFLPTAPRRKCCLNADQVLDIARHCPRLQDLRISVSRCRGGREEVAVYRALGRIPHLRRSQLNLVCDGETDTELVNAAFWSTTSHILPAEGTETVRKVMLNMATDKTLARAIWDSIMKEGTSKLEKLLIEPDRWSGHWGGYGFADTLEFWAQWIGRNWVCERVEKPSDDSEPRGDVEVREEIDPDFPPDSSYMKRLMDTNGVEVWESMWPSKGEDWWEEWHSCPLQKGDEVDEGATV
ncbi:hypothetical protein VTJ04DRAFT_8327 [Mycothermus thermophilus]|uniref:uncharacterized protein n=1 Tax=Humicola insolens TaxID=85995 RepID=UPI003743D1D9